MALEDSGGSFKATGLLGMPRNNQQFGQNMAEVVWLQPGPEVGKSILEGVSVTTIGTMPTVLQCASRIR